MADQCNLLAPTCNEYVAANPRAFSNAFWEINYIDVYQRQQQQQQPTLTPAVTNITPTISTVTQAISTATPTSTAGLENPTIIDGYTLLGCFGSLRGYETFSQIASFANMDLEACVASCRGRKYAGVSGE